jgi:hypothetical protein
MAGNAEPAPAIGIAWYRAEDYRQILEVMADKAILPSTYRQWRKEAELRESDLKRLGNIVIRVIVDPEIFPIWCRARGLNVDESARTAFVSEVAARQVREGH